MSSPILERLASISTATIEVKAIRVSGKQMTLAVFKQLPRRSILDSMTGELIGDPWGTVNYYWDYCCLAVNGAPGSHFHIIWTDGEVLYRDGIFSSWLGRCGERARDRWDENVDTLRQLDQLFIAV